MHALRQSFRVLVDPVDALPVALEARRWLWPMLFLVATVAFASAGFALRWNAGPGVLQGLEESGKLATMANAEVAEAVTTAERVKLISGLAFAAFVVPVILLAVAGALKFVLWLLGRKARYSAVFTVLTLALLPVAVFHLVLGVCELWQLTLTPEQVATLVPSNLSVLLHPASRKLGRLLLAVDFFGLWSAGLLGLGLAALTGMPRVRALVLGLSFYLTYVAVFVLGIPGLMGGHP